MYGLHEGAENEDFRMRQTVVEGIPVVNCYVPQGYSITSEKVRLQTGLVSAPAGLFREGFR